jgi:malate synthase
MAAKKNRAGGKKSGRRKGKKPAKIKKLKKISKPAAKAGPSAAKKPSGVLLNRPAPRKAPPRSIAARRAQPTGGPRGPAAARPKPVVELRPPAKTPLPVAKPPAVKPPAPKPAAPKPPPRAVTSTPKTGVRIVAPAVAGADQVLTAQAIDFFVGLERRFRPDIKRILAARQERQKRIDAGEKPDFLPETVNIRNGDWTVAPVPADLRDRRVEITGPTDRKMVINALNSGASCFMADFEDANTPTWSNLIEGQINLRDAVAGTIAFKDPATQKQYRLNPQTAVLIVRPRGWHMPERHVVVDGEPMAGALFDFGLYFFHNARPLIRNGSGPYFYLPKLQSHLEARLWNEIFLHAQRAFGLPRGTIKATVLIEHVLAAFEMDEILYELRDHAAGLNAGRWDYIFSFIKTFRNERSKVMPDRAKVTMTTHFLRSYSQLLVKTCHRREVHAMGGMAAQIPIKDNARANDEAMSKVRQDKEREAGDGHDGTWVAHPGLVQIAKDAFDKAMPQQNQIARKRQDVHVAATDLLQVPQGTKSEAGLRQNLAVGIGYIEAWLRGQGCVPLFNLMEDAATAEISRAQVWQWLKYHSRLEDGRIVTPELCRQVIQEEVAKLRAARPAGQPDKFDDAAALFDRLIEAPDCPEFLTLPAYAMLEG